MCVQVLNHLSKGLASAVLNAAPLHRVLELLPCELHPLVVESGSAAERVLTLDCDSHSTATATRVLLHAASLSPPPLHLHIDNLCGSNPALTPPGQQPAVMQGLLHALRKACMNATHVHLGTPSGVQASEYVASMVLMHLSSNTALTSLEISCSEPLHIVALQAVAKLTSLRRLSVMPAQQPGENAPLVYPLYDLLHGLTLLTELHVHCSLFHQCLGREAMPFVTGLKDLQVSASSQHA